MTALPPSEPDAVTHVRITAPSRSRVWILVAAVFFGCVVAVGVGLWVNNDNDPATVSTRFLDATSCAELRELSDGEHRIDARSCQILTDAAAGRRTYADPTPRTGLDRTIAVSDTVVDSDGASVWVRVSYGSEAPTEEMLVQLVPDGRGWLVHDWGLAG